MKSYRVSYPKRIIILALFLILIASFCIIYFLLVRNNCLFFCEVSFEEIGTGSAIGNGISDNVSGNSLFSSIAISPDGTPYIAWVHYSGTGYQSATIHIQLWNGSQWVDATETSEATDFSNPSEFSSQPAMAFANDGTLNLAWAGRDEEIRVERLTQGNWQELGEKLGLGNNTEQNIRYESFNPSIAVALDGTVYVAWESSINGKSQIYVSRWNGQNWEDIGCELNDKTGINMTQSATHPKIVADAEGTLYIAWTNIDKDVPFVYIKKWDGSCWQELSPGSASGTGLGQGGSHTLTIAPDGTLYIGWSYLAQTIPIRRWDRTNSEWDILDYQSSRVQEFLTRRKQYPYLDVSPDNTLYLTWVNSDIFGEDIIISRWNGSEWEGIASGLLKSHRTNMVDQYLSHPILAAAEDGTIYVAWLSSNSISRISNKVYALRSVK